MKLVDLLVKVLPGKGGWPDRATGCVQDNDGFACFFRNGKPKFISPCWSSEEYQNAFDWEGSVSLRETADDNSYAIISREQYESALAVLIDTAPQQVESLAWDGKGLPPVGCECEVWCEDHADYEWVRIKVFAEYKGTIIGIVNMPTQIIHDDINKYSAGYNRAEFRTIHTETERRRENIRRQLADAICGDIPDVGMASAYNYATRAFDAIAAGKIPGVKLED